MKQVFVPSVYTMEPHRSEAENAWSGHWNYQWHNRNSKQGGFRACYRKEGNGRYLVQDEHGVIWLMDEVEFRAWESEGRQSIA